jgi:predicted RND superfamily exporter protein
VGIGYIRYVDDISLVFMKQLPSTQALDDIALGFAPGLILPQFLTAVPKPGCPVQDVFGPEYFDEATRLLRAIFERTNGWITPNSVASLPIVGGRELSFELAFAAMVPLPVYRLLMDQVYSRLPDNRTCALIQMMLSRNPEDEVSDDAIQGVRDMLSEHEKHTNFTWAYGGIQVALIDAAAASFDDYPLMMGVTIAIIAVFITATMRSLVVPLRLVVSMAVTLGWTFGMCSWFFCAPEHSRNLYFFMPIFLSTIVIGLGIDYDVFLFTRITECREEGRDPSQAIREGYFHTGEVITGAGLVMAIAFSGLAASRLPALRQIGVFLAISVLLDTFVVRMLFVPCILQLLGRWNWWPSKLSRAEPIEPPESVMTLVRTTV